MRLNDNNTFIGINPPYQLSVIHSSKLIYPREIYQRGVERKRVELIARETGIPHMATATIRALARPATAAMCPLALRTASM